MSLASLYSLDRRLEVFTLFDVNARTGNEYQIERLVSYDNGETWVDNWIRNESQTVSSSPAGAITGDSLDAFLVANGPGNRFWFTHLQEYYEFKSTAWHPIGSGVFNGKPAVCCHGTSTTKWKSLDQPETTYRGVHLLAFGTGSDTRIWWAFSGNAGLNWDMAWSPIGDGRFVSSPAATCSADGKVLAVFAKSGDGRIWWAYSTSGGSSWDMAWSPIGEGVFNSIPAATCSADGQRIYVFARGRDDRIWWASTRHGVAKWDMAWSPIGEGVFPGSPSANCSWDGKIIHVFGKGKDNRIWQARSYDFGSSWDIAWRQIHPKQFVDVAI